MAVRDVTLFQDPTPDSIINLRFIFAIAKIAKENTDFSLEEFDDFMGELALIGWKLAATWRHLNNYVLSEDAMIKVANSRPPIETLSYQHLHYSQELYFELDEFLVQMKSTLDYLAKLPRSIVGKNSWPELHSFGQKGKRLIDAVKNNLPKRFEGGGEMVLMFLEDHKDWLQMAIEARDMINHNIKGGLSVESSLVVKTIENGNEVIKVPMWLDNLSLRNYMAVVWNNLFILVEQITIGFLSMRLKPGLGFIYNSVPISSVVSPIQVLPDNAVVPVAQFLTHLNRKRNEEDRQ